MKLSKIQMAVSAAIALAAGNASALPLATINGSEVKLYVGGATATDGAFANVTRILASKGGICADGSLDSYEYSAAAGGSVTQRLNYCTGAPGTTVAGKHIMIAKESLAGSAAGVFPVARAQARLFLPFSVAGLSTCEAVTTAVAATGDFAAYNYHRCSSTEVSALDSVVTTAGISDIDPTTFVGLGGVTAGDATALVSTTTVAVTFSPIVSLALYRALQSAQNLGQDDTFANMPTMTLSQLRAIFNGNVTDGNQLWSRNSTGGLTRVVSTGSKEIKVCRRGNTSGTMTSFKILFLGEGCSKNEGSIGGFVKPTSVYSGTIEDPETLEILPDPAAAIDAETSGVTWSTSVVSLFNSAGVAISGGYGSVRVFAGNSSTDVRSCIQFHSAANGATTLNQSLGNFAVGTASTENKPAAGVISSYRYIKVDGIEPSLKATMEGRYSLFTENTMNRATAGANLLTGDNLALFDLIGGKLGTASVLIAINSSWRDALGSGTTDEDADTGILDVATAANHLSATDLLDLEPRTKPLNGQTRFYQSKANNCNMSKQLFP
jgi:hypothetical protein